MTVVIVESENEMSAAERIDEILRMSPKELDAKVEELLEDARWCHHCGGEIRSSQRYCCIFTRRRRHELAQPIIDIILSGVEDPLPD